MSNRNLVHHTDAEPSEDGILEGWHNVLRIDRSAAGQPGLFFIIETWYGDVLAGEACVVVKDGNELLRPVLEWLGSGGIDYSKALNAHFPGVAEALEGLTALTPVPKVIDKMLHA